MFKDRIDDRGDPTRNEGESLVLELPARPQTGADKLRASRSARMGEVTALAPEAEKGPAPERPREAPAEAGEDRPKKAAARRRPLIRVFGMAALAVAAGAGAVWWDNASHFETTDDAFIASRPIGLAPQVPGLVAQVLVTDNQHVAKGQAIARIDDRDYLVALAQAQAKVAVAQAGVKNIDAQIAVQQAQVDAAQAQLDQAQAALAFAQQQATRYDVLARKGAGSVQNAQQYSSQLAQQQAAVKSASASLEVARRQVDSLQAQAKSAQADLALAKAQQDQARLNLSYTHVVAAESGRVVDLTAAPGEYAQTGTSLAMFVPDKVWVTANFKETELDHMRPSDPVTLRIDAYPERRIRGHVASVQPGSGTAFSLLPPENATGNYVKIVQRVPVKIELDNPPQDVALGPGMSVVPTVRVNPQPSLYERLVGFFDSKARPS
jgi:membrane fusion protein, multidrug efflux system